MRYFFHILTGFTVISDNEGAEFADQAAAEEEAAQSGRDLIAEELRCGRPAPVHWQVQITAADGGMLKSIAFSSLVNGMGRAAGASAQDAALAAVARITGFQERIAAAGRTSRLLHAEIRTAIAEVRHTLQKLDRP